MRFLQFALVGLLVLFVACATTSKKVMETTVVSGGPTPVEDGILFQLVDENYRTVHLAGEFNGWSTTDEPMTKNEKGIWQVVIYLDPGTYQYKFVIDGGIMWKHDPNNPNTTDDGYGGFNSVYTVK